MDKFSIKIIFFLLILISCSKENNSFLEEVKNSSSKNSPASAGTTTTTLPPSVPDPIQYCDLSKTKIKKMKLGVLSPQLLTQGEVSSFNLSTTIEYDLRVQYYIPSSIDLTKLDEVSSVIFLHGGGGSTGGLPDGALGVANTYINSFLRDFSEENQFISIVPVSPLNWGWNTSFIVRDLAKYLKNVEGLNPNKIVVSGHSMGGMGLSRSSYLVIDQVAGVAPSASGVEVEKRQDWKISSYFNTIFKRQQGLNDHFEEFVTYSREEEAQINDLSALLNFDPNYRLYEHNGNHNLNASELGEQIREIASEGRNIYQKRLFANFYFSERRRDIFQWPNLHLHSLPTFFWLEALEFDDPNFDTDQVSTSTLIAEIKDQKIFLQDQFRRNKVNKLRIYLSNELLDLSKPIQIIYEDQDKSKKIGEKTIIIRSESKENIKKHMQDASFEFDECIDVTLNLD